jgi:hypothetical protein
MVIRPWFLLSKRHCLEWLCLCGGLNESVLHRLRYLNSCSPVSSTVWGPTASLRGGALLEEVHHWGHCFVPVFEGWVLNFLLLFPCLPFVAMHPWRNGFLLCWNWSPCFITATRKVTNTEVGTREWAVVLKSPIMLAFGGMWETLELWFERWLSVVDRV